MNAHTDFGIPSKAAIGRHPIHPMLVPLPIGFFVSSLLLDLAFWASPNTSVAMVSAWLVAAGLATGLLAAVAGIIDFLGSADIRALYHAWYHLVGNVAALALALLSFILRANSGPEAAVLPWGVLLSAVIVALLVFTGWHGGEMVFGHGAGMEPHEHEPHHRGGPGHEHHSR
jgi:uncharacterized membrane protein